jgi:prepilin-type N-terminal cleavage/methylation domain-containing protein
MRGFTLLEILIVVGISLILFYLIIPVGLDFYKSQQIDNETRIMVQTLKRAQSKAMAAESDSKFGVYINNDNYILFRGDSYASRNSQYDEVFDLSGSITIEDSPKEIVFSKVEGTPSFAGGIVFNGGNQTRKVLINKFGVISLE